MFCSKSRRSARAFTLVELLVVIGIIAVLIGVLLPALGRAREQSKAVQCLSNLRSLGQGMLLYLNDNKQNYHPNQITDHQLVGNDPVGADTTDNSVYSWTGQTADNTTAGVYTRRMSTDVRWLNRYINPKLTWQSAFPLAKCPTDEAGFATYGSSYIYNLSNGTPPPGFDGLGDQGPARLYTIGYIPNNRVNATVAAKFGLTTATSANSAIKASRIKNSAEFVIAGENPAFLPVSPSTVTYYKYYHYKNKREYNVLFADGHAAPVIEPDAWFASATYWKDSSSPPPGVKFKGDGFNFERLPATDF